jgi:hypothetical protein
MRPSFRPVPNWFSFENQGVGIAATSLAPGRDDAIVFMVDAPVGRNRGLFRAAKGLHRDGTVDAWTEWREVPGWPSDTNDGAGIAVADVTGSGTPDLVVFLADAPIGENRGLYRIGKDLDAEGRVAADAWTDWQEVPGWESWSNQGAAIALADLDGSGSLDLIVFAIDNPNQENAGRFRVGRNLDANGVVTGGWTGWQNVPTWFSWENQGAGVAVVERVVGRKDLIVFHVDDPPGQNQAFYRFGLDFRADGRVHAGWSPWFGVPDWFSWQNQGASISLAHLGGAPQLLVLAVDSPAGPNTGLYQVLPLASDPATQGSWELLPYNSEVLAVHAALLPNGKVLFFAGSGNSAVRFEAKEFGDTTKENWCSVVWDPNGPLSADGREGSFFHPDTLFGPDPDHRPLDFFCGGDSLLADGSVFSAGGTLKYDVDKDDNKTPTGFVGRKEAQVFNPVTRQWRQVASMAEGRWYPTVITLGDGRMLVASGLIAGKKFNVTLEIYTPASDTWERLALPLLMRLLGLPLYAHLFQLAGGEIFFTGGRMDDINPTPPCLLDLTQNPVGIRVIQGLQAAFSRNQSASIPLGPAQDQRFLLMGGAPPVGETSATDNVDLIDLRDLSGDMPRFRPAAPMLLPRVHLNAVLLPDRTVFVSGGALQREGGPQGERRTVARLESEIYDPEHDRWTLAANASVVRMYHSVALLLPDGRVVTAGGNPDKGHTVGWEHDDNEELQLELYSPPYMFRPRPTITDAPEAWQYGHTVTLRSPQAADILWASLIRPGVTTHSFNTSQRMVDLPVVFRDAGQIDVSVTADPNIAPPGWYMLFLTDNTRTPSVATWIRIG